MDKKKDLFSLASDIETACALLEELDLLMNILDDEMEEGCQPNSIVEWKAVWFVKRLPMRQALLRTIQREFEQRIKELDEVSSQLMEMYKAQKALPEAPTTLAE